MRKAINITEANESTVNYGRIEKKEVVTTKLVAIDNYGQMPVSMFIKKLVDRGRLAWEYRAKASMSYTNDFLTKLLNENEDLFPVQF